MTDSKPRIGFIGLGLMGEGFTRRLVDLGYVVTGFDIDAAKVEGAAGHGVVGAASAREVAENSDHVLVCVMPTAAVHDAVLGDAGVVHAPGEGKVLVDFSTTVVADTKAIAAQLRERSGMGWVDAPVSGGPPAARDGTLAIMAGGAPEDVARVEPVMADLASRFTHMGPVGAGQITKMVNQVVVLNNFCVLAEAFALAEAGGIDAAKVPEALGTGYAGSRFMDVMFPRMVERDFAPAGRVRQVLKDLDMVQDLARELNVPTPMTSETTALYRILVSKGYADLDAIAVLKLLDGNDSV